MTTNLLTTLESLRPDAHIDELWPPTSREAERARIMATDTGSEVPPAQSRRVGTIVVVAAIAAAGGVGIAAAAGLMPKAFTDAYSGWLTSPETPNGVDPAAAERIASLPGPDGTVFSVFVAHGPNGWRCVAPVFESAADVDQSGPSDFAKLGDSCRPAEGPGVFGGGLGFMSDPHGFIFDAAAGEAVRAELHTADGEILPTVLVDGRFLGWGPLPPGSPRPTVVGYAADGTVVGTR